MRTKSRRLASAALGISSALCMAFGAALLPSAKTANAEASVGKKDLFYIEGIDKNNYVSDGAAGSGMSFTEGNNLNFVATNRDSTRFTGSKTLKPEIERKSQTTNTINGSFKGDFSINYEVIDYLKCYNAAMWNEAGDLVSDNSARSASEYFAKTQKVYKQGAMTFRFAPLAKSDMYIDVCLTFIFSDWDVQRGIIGSYIVVFNDGTGNKYVRTIARSGQTIPETDIAVWSSGWGQQNDWNNQFTSKAMEQIMPSAPRFDNQGRTHVDYDSNNSSIRSTSFSSSTLSLVWDGDVLKIQGKAGADGATYTYAAFDGTKSDSFTSAKPTDNNMNNIVARAQAAAKGEEGANAKYTDGTQFCEYTDYGGDLIFGGCGLPKVNSEFANGYSVTIMNNAAQYDFSKLKSKDTTRGFQISGAALDSGMDTSYFINTITGTGTNAAAMADTVNFTDGESAAAKPSWAVSKSAKITIDGVAENLTIAPTKTVYEYTLTESNAEHGADELFLYYYDVNDPENHYQPGDVISLADGDNLELKSKFSSNASKSAMFSPSVNEVGEEGAKTPYGAVTASGYEFDAGTKIEYIDGVESGKKTSSVSVLGEETAVGINGNFSGNFSMKYQLKNYYPYINGNADSINAWESNVVNHSTQSFHSWVQKIGWFYNVVMTTRIKSNVAGHEKEFIDVNLLLVSGSGDSYRDLIGMYVVVYNDGNGNQYVRTLPVNGTYSAEIPVYGTTWAPSTNPHGSVSAGVFGNNNATSPYYAMITVDENGNYKARSANMSPTTLSLEWEGDVLKIVGQADVKDKVTPKVTYAAFDGTATDEWNVQAKDSNGISNFFVNKEYEKNKCYYLKNTTGYKFSVLAGGCKLPKVSEAFASYSVEILNVSPYDAKQAGSLVSTDEYEAFKANKNGNQAADMFCNKASVKNGSGAGYTIMNICGTDFTGVGETIAKPDWYNNVATVVIDGVANKIDLGAAYCLPAYTGTLAADQAFKGYLVNGVRYAAGDELPLEKGKTYNVVSEIVTAKVTLDGAAQENLDFNAGFTLPEYMAEDKANFIGYLASGNLYKAGAKLQFSLENYELNVYPIVLKAEFSPVEFYLKNTADETVVRFVTKLTGRNLDHLAGSGILFKTTIKNAKYEDKVLSYAFDTAENLIEGESGEYYLSAGLYGLTAYTEDNLTVSSEFTYTLEGDEAATTSAPIVKTTTIATLATTALKAELAKAESERDTKAIAIYKALGGKEE